MCLRFLRLIWGPGSIPRSTLSYNKVRLDVHVIDFQKIPVVLSKCDGIAIESTFEIGDVKSLQELQNLIIEPVFFFCALQSIRHCQLLHKSFASFVYKIKH